MPQPLARTHLQGRNGRQASLLQPRQLSWRQHVRQVCLHVVLASSKQAGQCRQHRRRPAVQWRQQLGVAAAHERDALVNRKRAGQRGGGWRTSIALPCSLPPAACPTTQPCATCRTPSTLSSPAAGTSGSRCTRYPSRCAPPTIARSCSRRGQQERAGGLGVAATAGERGAAAWPHLRRRCAGEAAIAARQRTWSLF